MIFGKYKINVFVFYVKLLIMANDSTLESHVIPRTSRKEELVTILASKLRSSKNVRLKSKNKYFVCILTEKKSLQYDPNTHQDR